MLKYIEQKTGHADNGPAWIARVTSSRSGRTVYFNGKALKRIARGGIGSNYYDLETGDEYWVSGVKKRGLDRHWAGSGVVFIEVSAVDEYLQIVGRTALDVTRLSVVDDLAKTDPSEFYDLENEVLKP